MRDMNFFQLILYYLEERQSNSIYTNLQKDIEFLNASEQEQDCANAGTNLCQYHFSRNIEEICLY